MVILLLIVIVLIIGALGAIKMMKGKPQAPAPQQVVIQPPQ
jgi:hypothetical protein